MVYRVLDLSAGALNEFIRSRRRLWWSLWLFCVVVKIFIIVLVASFFGGKLIRSSWQWICTYVVVNIREVLHFVLILFQYYCYLPNTWNCLISYFVHIQFDKQDCFQKKALPLLLLLYRNNLKVEIRTKISF